MGARSLRNEDDNVYLSSDALLKLLVAVRGSSIPDRERIALRDLVLAYAQATEPDAKRAADTKLREALKVHEAELGPAFPFDKTGDAAKAPAHKEEKPPAAPAPQAPAGAVRHTRRVPSFHGSSASEKMKPKVETRVPAPASEPKAAAIPPPPPKDETVIPVRVQKNEPEPSSDVAPPPERKYEPKTEIPAAPEAKPVEAAPFAGDPKVRIAEIKRAVNERVGNPVNLIDRNREVGQEYMAALLDAMKRSNSGGGVGAAMSRLEKAYAAAIQAIETEPKEAPAPAPEAPEKREPAAVPIATPQPQPDRVKPKQQEMQSEQPAPVPPAPAAVHERAPRATSIPIRSIPPPPRPQAHAQTKAAVEDMMANNAVRKPTPAAPRKLVSLADLKTDTVRAKSVVPEVRTQAPSTPQEPAADAKPAAQSAWSHQEPQTPPHQTKGRQSDPEIFSSKVDAGLAQLLSEWKLFKSSGLFGTGPHGIDHPLYKKLAQLPMAAVVAGRFEGATPEIRQNIADYMNGWRYEHGLVHRMDEQFEQYLRRVISHILENQKSTKPETEGASKAKMVP